jgi:hydroxymethylglutaryl-CoA reductase (NADPH)
MSNRTGEKFDPSITMARGHFSELQSTLPEALLDEWTSSHRDEYQRNIENMIGTVKVPVGVAGPLLVNGTHAEGAYKIPLATTEATLVASYHRGCKLISAAGGCRALLIDEGVRRAPGFAFENLNQVSEFVAWVRANFSKLRAAAASSTRFGELIDLHVDIEGNHVYLGFEYLVGDAAGQNMVTIATQETCDYILAHSPVKPQYHFIEANLSGDKKASALSFRSVRGKKVSVEIELPASLVKSHLHTSAEHMVEYWRMSAIGGVLSGSIGIQGHYANGLAALYIACGQDVACVAESAVGVTRFELTPDGDLYAAVTLPNLTVGTVGGGTGLPSQLACLELMNLAGGGNARAFAEVTAGLLLAGELSIIGALSAGHFVGAHKRLARGD